MVVLVVVVVLAVVVAVIAVVVVVVVAVNLRKGVSVSASCAFVILMVGWWVDWFVCAGCDYLVVVVCRLVGSLLFVLLVRFAGLFAVR